MTTESDDCTICPTKWSYSTCTDYYNLQNKEEGKSSDVEVPLSSAFLEETVQLGIKSDTMTIHWIIGILEHRTN